MSYTLLGKLEFDAPPPQRVHRIVAGVQTGSALLLGFFVPTGARVPLVTHLPPERVRGELWHTAEQELGSWPIGYLSVIFLGLSALHHLVLSTDLHELYYQNLMERGEQRLRWWEYAFSASVMHWMIAQLCGVTDLHTLLGITGLTMATMLMGALDDRTRDPQLKLNLKWGFNFFGGCFWLMSWAPALSYFIWAADRAPGFVWAIVVILLLLDLCFAVLQLLRLWTNDFKTQAVRREWGFVLLSLTAKQALAWINFGGTQAL